MYSDGVGDNMKIQHGEMTEILETSFSAQEAQERIIARVKEKMGRLNRAKKIFKNPQLPGGRRVEIQDKQGVPHLCVELDDFPGAFIDPQGIMNPEKIFPGA